MIYTYRIYSIRCCFALRFNIMPKDSLQTPTAALLTFARSLRQLADTPPRAPLRHQSPDGRKTPLELLLACAQSLAEATTPYAALPSASPAADEAADSGSCRRIVGRTIKPRVQRLESGEEVLAWKNQWASVDHCWLRSFTYAKFGTALEERRLKSLKNYCSKCCSAYVADQTDVGKDHGRLGQGRRVDGCRCQRVPQKSRSRAIGGGRRAKLPDLSNEFVQYWVDRAEDLKAHVPSSDLLQHANHLLSCAREAHARMSSEGIELELVDSPKGIAYVWLYRWRKEWGLTHRSVTLVCKASWPIARKRYGVMWRNCFRMRFLHSFLYGAGLLRFLNMDETFLVQRRVLGESAGAPRQEGH